MKKLQFLKEWEGHEGLLIRLVAEIEQSFENARSINEFEISYDYDQSVYKLYENERVILTYRINKTSDVIFYMKKIDITGAYKNGFYMVAAKIAKVEIKPSVEEV